MCANTNTHYQVRFYANNYFEWLPIVSTAFKTRLHWFLELLEYCFNPKFYLKCRLYTTKPVNILNGSQVFEISPENPERINEWRRISNLKTIWETLLTVTLLIFKLWGIKRLFKINLPKFPISPLKKLVIHEGIHLGMMKVLWIDFLKLNGGDWLT